MLALSQDRNVGLTCLLEESGIVGFVLSPFPAQLLAEHIRSVTVDMSERGAVWVGKEAVPCTALSGTDNASGCDV